MDGYKRAYLVELDGVLHLAGVAEVAAVPLDAVALDATLVGTPEFHGFWVWQTRAAALRYRAPGARHAEVPVVHVTLDGVLAPDPWEDRYPEPVRRWFARNGTHQRVLGVEFPARCGCGAPVQPGCVSTRPLVARHPLTLEGRPVEDVHEVVGACAACTDDGLATRVAAAGLALTARTPGVQAWCDRPEAPGPTACVCRWGQEAGTQGDHGAYGGHHWYATVLWAFEFVSVAWEWDAARGALERKDRLATCRVCGQRWYHREWWDAAAGRMHQRANQVGEAEFTAMRAASRAAFGR